MDQLPTGFFSLVRRWRSHAPPPFSAHGGICGMRDHVTVEGLDTNYSLCCV